MANNETNTRLRKKFYRRFDDSIKNYIKEFESFEEGYNEIISIIPALKVYGGDVANYDLVVKKMIELIGDNIPSPSNPNFPNTLAFTIKQNEVSFRTDERIAFGWKIFFNRETGKHIYQMRITFLAVSMSTRKYADALLEYDWVIVDGHNKERFQKNNNGNSKRYNKFEKKQQSQEEISGQSVGTQDDEINTEEQELLDKVAEPVVEVNDVQEQQDNKKQQDQKNYWITKGAVAGVFIITYEGRSFVVNVNDAAQPAGVFVDKNSSTIRIGLVSYNYETMNYVIDEGSSQFNEKQETEEDNEFIIPQSNGKPIINTPSMSQMLSPSGTSATAQTVVKVSDI